MVSNVKLSSNTTYTPSSTMIVLIKTEVFEETIFTHIHQIQNYLLIVIYWSRFLNLVENRREAVKCNNEMQGATPDEEMLDRSLVGDGDENWFFDPHHDVFTFLIFSLWCKLKTDQQKNQLTCGWIIRLIQFIFYQPDCQLVPEMPV